jgi:hypothetical protein
MAFSAIPASADVGLTVKPLNALAPGENVLYGNALSGSTGSLLLLQKNATDMFKIDSNGSLVVGSIPAARISGAFDSTNDTIADDGVISSAEVNFNYAGSGSKGGDAYNADTVDGHHFNWSGQSGQPTWLWGGNDSANMYVYNPSNFSVNYAGTAGNVNSLSGTWDGLNYFRSNKGASSYVGANSSYGLEAYSTDGGAAGMSFHRGGYYAVNMGLDPDNVFRIGGWSAGSNRLQMDMSGNLTMAGYLSGTNHYANGNLYFSNYGQGVVGVYSATRYQGVFSMGDSYKLSADGTSAGTLYGIAWTHSNIGGQSKSGLGHQALFMENGVTQTAIGNGVWTRADYTGVNYYSSGWFRNTNNLEGLYSQANGSHFYASSGNYWNLTANNSSTGYPSLLFRSNHQSTIRGYVYSDSSGFGLLSNRGNWAVRIPYNSEDIYHYGNIYLEKGATRTIKVTDSTEMYGPNGSSLIIEAGNAQDALGGNLTLQGGSTPIAPRGSVYINGGGVYFSSWGGTMDFDGSLYVNSGDIYSGSAGKWMSNTITKSGDTVDGVIYFRSNKGSGSYVGSNNTYQLEAYSNDGGAAGMSFHRGGAYAVNMGLDPDNVLRIGGWSAGANRWQLDMSGNNYVAGSYRVVGGASTIQDSNQFYCNSGSECYYNWSGSGRTNIGNGSGVYIPYSLGVGTGSPWFKAHVTGGQLGIGNGGGIPAVLAMVPSSSGSWWNIGNSNNGSYLRFATGDTRSWNDTTSWNSSQMTLDTGGNLSLSGMGYLYGGMNINNASPTIFFQDTDHRSSMIHVNSNIFYVLRGCGTNSGSWCTTGGYWPLEINLENNAATFGGTVTAVGGVKMGVSGPTVKQIHYTGYTSGSNNGRTCITISRPFDLNKVVDIRGTIRASGDSIIPVHYFENEWSWGLWYENGSGPTCGAGGPYLSIYPVLWSGYSTLAGKYYNIVISYYD